MLLLNGDNIKLLQDIPDNSVDSVVTDPPYGLSFMNNKWDHDVPSKYLWMQVRRVLKPGGHLLSFGGTRTYHRMACAIEDAGFEIRDQIMWIYGSGFPKSHNISKALDKKGIDGSEWDGFGTGLKPANEPIVLARKPLSEKTIADNVIKWGTGALNIDGSRIETTDKIMNHSRGKESSKSKGKYGDSKAQETHQTKGQSLGRFPANIILDDHAKDQEWSRYFYCPKVSKKERGPENLHPTVKPIKLMEYLIKLVTPPGGTVLDPYMGSGSTGIAAKNLDFDFIGMELDESYFKIARNRIENT